MALYKKSEFAAKLGITKAYVSMSIKRGKIILTEQGQIDSTNPINAAFEQHQAQLAVKRQVEKKEPVNETRPEKQPVVLKTEKPVKSIKSQVDSKARERYDKKLDAETSVKEKQVEKHSREIAIMELKLAKLKGQVIPTDLVASAVRQFSQACLVSFTNAADALMVDLAKKLKLDRAQQAEFRKALKEKANIAVNTAINDTQKSIDNIVIEHSQNKNAA